MCYNEITKGLTSLENLNDLSIEEKREFVSQFNLIDDTFCSVVLEDKKACEYLLSALLGMEIEVVENKTQYSIKSIMEHSIILDVLVKDKTGRFFNVEINTYGEDHAHRLRFYSSLIDSKNLEKNKPYKKLPDLYMIYISKEDVLFGDDENFKHRNHYEIVQYVKGTDAVYDNGLYIHYFNTSVKDDNNKKLTELLEFIEKSDPKNNSFGALSERVNFFKYESEGVGSMCKIVQDYAKKYAKEYGDEREIKGKMECVENLLKKNFTLDEALETTKLNRETYEKYCQDQ